MQRAQRSPIIAVARAKMVLDIRAKAMCELELRRNRQHSRVNERQIEGIADVVQFAGLFEDRTAADPWHDDSSGHSSGQR